MAKSEMKKLLTDLLSARSAKEVQTILNGLGDHPAAALDEPFGPHQLQWHAFGNNPSNLSTIGLGTKPGRSLTERITNAIDAVLEDRVPTGVKPPGSPRIAAQSWFGRPISGFNRLRRKRLRTSVICETPRKSSRFQRRR